MDNAPQDFNNLPSAPKKSKRPLIIASVVILVALGLGFFLFRKSSSNKPAQVAGTTTEAPTPTPTPAPPVDKMTVKIQVLNGTGTPGQATKVAASLKTAGYNPDNIKTGNAPENITTSTIAAKAGFESTAADIKTALSADFPDIEVSSTALDASGDFDIVVTTGGTKYVAPTATPTPTGSATPTPTGSDTSTPTPTDTPTPTPTP